MSIIFQSADDEYRALRSQYARELRRQRMGGAMSDREYLAWRDEGQIDTTKFPNIKDLWNKLESSWPKTRRGLAEAKDAAADSPVAQQIIELQSDHSQFDEKVFADLANRFGITPATTLANALACDVAFYLASFRRVRGRMVGSKAFECLSDGQTAIEIVKGET